MKRINFILLVRFVFILSLLITQNLRGNSQTDSSKYISNSSIFIQNGYFQSIHNQNINGLKYLSIGFIKSNKIRKSWGIEAYYKTANKFEIKEYITPFDTFYSGGNMKYKEAGINYLILTNLISKGKTKLGIQYGFGYKYYNLTTDPDYAGNKQTVNSNSLNIQIEPFITYKLSKSIDLYIDFNIFQFITGSENYSSENFENYLIGSSSLFMLNNINWGIIFKI